jgi:hypothetical protein
MLLESVIPCPTAPSQNRRPRRTTHANFFMCAPAAEQSCGRRKVIAACSAPVARSPVPRFSPGAPANLALALAVEQFGVASDAIQPSRNWLGSARTHAFAWWSPQAGIVAALMAPVPFCAVIWIVALDAEEETWFTCPNVPSQRDSDLGN